MYGVSSQDIVFSSEHKRILQELTILRDFEILLDYLREGDLSITGTHQLPLRVGQTMVYLFDFGDW